MDQLNYTFGLCLKTLYVEVFKFLQKKMFNIIIVIVWLNSMFKIYIINIIFVENKNNFDILKFLIIIM